MPCPPKTKAGRLLRVLFLRVGSMPVGPTAHRTGKALTPRRKLSEAELREQAAAAFLAWRAGQTSKDGRLGATPKPAHDEARRGEYR